MRPWIYWVYGLILFIPGIILFLIVLMQLINQNSTLSYITILMMLPFFPSIAYLVLAYKKLANRLTDISIKIGFIFVLIFLVIAGIPGLYEEIFRVTLFPENWIIGLYLPIFCLVLLIITFLILLIGLFQEKIINQ